jgi:hypothetical protein
VSIRRSQGQNTPGANALETALEELGVLCRVETRDKLAVIVTDADGAKRFGESDVRQRALAIARQHGYTHLALELK